MVTWDEIKVALHQEGREQGAARKLVEFVTLYWNEAVGQAFWARLENRDARHWPSLRDLKTAYEDGRDPCVLLEAPGASPMPKANGRASAAT